MLRNEVSKDGAAAAMEDTAATAATAVPESSLYNQISDALSDPKTLAVIGGAALATAAAVKFGRPLLELGKSAIPVADEAALASVRNASAGDLTLKPATQALIENSIPISKATRSLVAGETTVLAVEKGGRLHPATEALLAHSKPIRLAEATPPRLDIMKPVDHAGNAAVPARPQPFEPFTALDPAGYSHVPTRLQTFEPFTALDHAGYSHVPFRGPIKFDPFLPMDPAGYSDVPLRILRNIPKA